MSSLGFYLLTFLQLLSLINCMEWWKDFGVSYSNPGESDANRYQFNEFRFDNNLLDTELDSESKRFASTAKKIEKSSADNHRLGSQQSPVPLAINTKRTVDIIPYNAGQRVFEPKFIEISSKPVPLELNFKSYSTPLDLDKIFNQDVSTFAVHSNRLDEKASQERPQLLKHTVIKPAVNGVNEINEPFRHYSYHIRPVLGNIRAFVSEDVHQTNRQYHHLSPDTGHLKYTNGYNIHQLYGNSLDQKFGNYFGNTIEKQNPKLGYIDHNSGQQQSFRQRLTSEIDYLPESNQKTTYRIQPIIIRRVGIWNSSPIERHLSQNTVQHIIKILKL